MKPRQSKRLSKIFKWSINTVLFYSRSVFLEAPVKESFQSRRHKFLRFSWIYFFIFSSWKSLKFGIRNLQNNLLYLPKKWCGSWVSDTGFKYNLKVTPHMELSAQCHVAPRWRGVWGRMDTCTCMAESLCCSLETCPQYSQLTTLLTGYNSIQNKK